MERKTPPLNSSQDGTMAAYHGKEQKVDDKTIFCTPDPLAASTVTRETNRMNVPTSVSSKGSFLDDWSRLSLQSVSAMDLTQQLKQLNFTLTSEVAPQEKARASGDSGPDLIQFSGNTELDNSDQETNKSESLTSSSSRSSMGLIPSEILNELSASVLPLSNSTTNPKQEAKPLETNSSHSTLKERTTDSKDWSDNSKQDSKQDSKDLPWGRSQLETVKKRPQSSSINREDEPLPAAPRCLFAGHLLDNVAEGEELDQSMHNVELGEEDLNQLDADINFSDLEEGQLSGRESGDEDFDFDEPMLSLPTTGRVERGGEEMGDVLEGRALQAELAEAGCRLGEGRESEESGATAQPLDNATVDLGLDSRYFRKTSMPFAGDGEDSEVASSRSSVTTNSQQRGAAEGEHLLTKLRRQFMSGDGSENEIDTEDELEAARRSLALATRERGQGADEEDSDRSNLPLPVGLEDDKSSNGGNRGNRRSDEQVSLFSYLTRQRAEGDVSHSPLPWDGGGGGDGSSGGDSDGDGGNIPASATRPPFRYVSGAAGDPDQPVSTEDEALMSSSSRIAAGGDRLGLQSKFFLPTSPSSELQDSEVTSPDNPDGSTFRVEDILKPSAEVLPTITKNKHAEASGVEAFGAKNVPENPFEDQFASSFGSFGLAPEEEETEASAANRPVEKESGQDVPRDTAEQTPSPKAELSTKMATSEVTSKGSGSFDGPFRKPRAPAPPRKKTDRKETYTADRSDGWKNALFQGSDVSGAGNLERQLRELGISVGDDDFHSAEGGLAMLDAEEKRFQEENKFSEHHQLALAAEGLDWEGEDSCFSGFLGGEEQAEHLETSIGTYMAARTETLGTLGGDPRIPRPEFGKPLRSPPHRLFPLKIMSPPSASSSVLSSRTDGEGDEEGNSTLHASALSLPGKPEDPPPQSLKKQQLDITDTAAADTTAAEVTMKEELSSMYLDMTQGGGDMTMEDFMSSSAVLDFFKNHSFSKASDFVSAIMKLSQDKKQHQGGRGGDSAAREQATAGGDDPKKGVQRKMAHQQSDDTLTGKRSKGDDPKKGVQRKMAHQQSDDTLTGKRSKGQLAKRSGDLQSRSEDLRAKRSEGLPTKRGEDVNARRSEGLCAPVSSGALGQSDATSTASLHTAPQRGSRLPVRVGATPSIGDRGSGVVKRKDENRQQTSKGDSVAEDSASSRKSHLGKQPVSENSVQDISRQNEGESGRELSGQRGDENQNRTVSTPVPGVPSTEGKKSSLLPSREFLSANQQRQESLRTNASDKKASAHVHFERDPAESFRSPQLSTDHRISSKENAQREKGPGQSKEKGETAQNASDSRNIESLNIKTSAQPQTFPLNIPVGVEAEKIETVKKDRSVLQRNDHDSAAPTGHTKQEEEKWKDCKNWTHRYMLQFPQQKLPAGNQLQTSTTSSSWPQESTRSHTSLMGQSLQLTGDVMLGSAADSRFPAKTAEPRPFDVTPTARGYQQPVPSVSQEIAQRLGALPQTASSSDPHRQPTLLTGTSLLRTEFAQKFLTPGVRGQMGTASTHVTPDHLPPDESCLPTPSIHLSFQSAQAYGSHQRHHPSSVIVHQNLPANSMVQAVDESAMSGYYELNEDPEHSTMLGIEGSALGSFWGKSPLFQSTPALEMGKQAAISMMESRLDERELNTPGTNMVTPRVQRQLIQIQREFDFQGCCLGVSQKTVLAVTNRTAHVVTCRFHLVRVLHDRHPVRLDQQCPFELKPKKSISAGLTENVPVLFVPRRAGEHVCQIEVHAQSLNPTLEPTISVVQLKAVAEVPRIHISPDVEVLEFGEVTWGGCLSKTIKIRNVNKASIPVRLSIWSGSSVWHCFTFDNCDNSSDLSIISMTSRPESIGRNVITVILPGCDSPDVAKTVEIILYCRPPKKELNRALAERPAEQIDAKIDIEVDTPVKNLPPLESVLLHATVGMPRLLIPTHQMHRVRMMVTTQEGYLNHSGSSTKLTLSSLTFRTRAHKTMQENITVNNSGNITLTLALSIATFSECFKISASQLTIKPGDRKEVAVVFSPQDSSACHYQSLLQLDVEPEGPSYEIPLEGQISGVGNQQRVVPNILTSKSYLSFHGVSLSQARSHSIKLFNKDRHNAEHACVEVHQSADCFKLVSTSGEWQQKCNVVIKPGEAVTLMVIFCPTTVQGYSGKLVIRKPDAHSTKYSVHMSGYGGRSVLNLSGACLTNSGQRWLEMGSLSLSQNIMREIMLTNTGVRAAFVRASAFNDMPCQQPVVPGRVAVEPNNFVLAPGCSMKVMVAMSPSQREVDLVRTRKEVVAVVRFQYGDEAMRQKYQRACSRDGGVDSQSWQAAFRQPFANEAQDSIIVEGSSIPDSPDDSSAFFHHMESLCVALLAQPAPGQQTSSMSVSAVLQSPSHQADSTSSLPTHDRTFPHPREEKHRVDSTPQFAVPGRPDDEEVWDVKPDFLSLTVGENVQKMVQLINLSKQPLSYQLSWPPNSVVPEPQKGEMKPRSKTSIEVWLHMAWQQRLTELPWRGAITVTCNGQKKNIKVVVQKPAQTPRHPVSSPHSSPASGLARSPQSATSDTPCHSLQLATTTIHFAKARINKLHESVLELTNASMEPVQMKLSPFAPAYVKGADVTNTVKRVSYTVFSFPSTTADLLPQETIKLLVKFCPQSKGTFNQHWEIEYWPLAGSKKTAQGKRNVRFSLTAEVTEQEVTSKRLTWDPVEQDKPGVSSMRAPLQEKHPNTGDSGDARRPVSAPDLQLLQSEVTFSNSRVGQIAQARIELKNSLDHNVQLKVDPPSAPFRIKHKTFKITKKRVLKYPIEFSPSTAGSFADTMVFHAPEVGKTFTVSLKGTAS